MKNFISCSIYFLIAGHFLSEVTGYPSPNRFSPKGGVGVNVMRSRSSLSLGSPSMESNIQLGRLRAIPVQDSETGRWFFDWFWGPDPGHYYPPQPVPGEYGPVPIPPPPPILPLPYNPIHEPLEYCTQVQDHLTGDIIEDCYPIN